MESITMRASRTGTGERYKKNSPYNQLLKLTIWTICVRRMRLELTRRNRHYPLKVACLPIPPPAREKVPRTGLEPACLSTHAPETCASTNSATWAIQHFSVKQSLSIAVAKVTTFLKPPNCNSTFLHKKRPPPFKKRPFLILCFMGRITSYRPCHPYPGS